MQGLVGLSELCGFHLNEKPLVGLKQASTSTTWSLDVSLE